MKATPLKSVTYAQCVTDEEMQDEIRYSNAQAKARMLFLNGSEEELLRYVLLAWDQDVDLEVNDLVEIERQA